MSKIDHHQPIKFVGMYFIDEHGEDYRTGQIIAQISEGYYLAQFDCPNDNVPPAPLEVLSAADFNKVCDNCGSRHWQFFPDVKTRQRWISWLTTPDPDRNSERLSEPRRRAVMRENNRWILAGASAGVMLMVLEAVPAELTSDNHWAQAYGRQDKDCLEWSDTCVICVRAQSGGDYSCSNIGIACQPKEVRCMRRADEKTK